MDLVPLRHDFEYRTQKRKRPASSTWEKKDIAGADFETKDGFPHIFTWSVWKDRENVWKDYSWVFGGTEEEPTMFLEANGGKERPAFNISRFCYALFKRGNLPREDGESEGNHKNSIFTTFPLMRGLSSRRFLQRP